MDKPIIFFSHSSRDKESLARLKELFVEKTGGTIDVFLSSDGQSIPLGRNWVHRLQDALEKAKIMVIFITPNSARSDWIYFESGFAYAKTIRVVPVGFLGMDIGALHPPLSLLQGFNITSEDGLDNLIALVNDEFGHKHSSIFGADEYREIARTELLAETLLGQYTTVIDEIRLHFESGTEPNNSWIDSLTILEQQLSEEEVDFEYKDFGALLHGAAIEVKGLNEETEDYRINAKVDPTIAAITLPLLERWFQSLRKDGVCGIRFTIAFNDSVMLLGYGHKISGRLFGKARLRGGNSFTFREVDFMVSAGRVSQRYRLGQTKSKRFPPYLEMTLNCDHVPIGTIRELVEILFNRGILYFDIASAP